MKRLVTILMADYWEMNADSKRQCIEELRKLDITPVLSRGDTHLPGDGSHFPGSGCNPWPPPSQGRGWSDISVRATMHGLRNGARNASSSGTLHSCVTPLRLPMLPLHAVGLEPAYVSSPKRMLAASLRPLCCNCKTAGARRP